MHKYVWKLAGPIILANVTVPLLGAIDIAVVGHLPGPQYMAAVGIGATIFSALYFGFVFLRMGTTGLVAIAKGETNRIESSAWLIRALMIALSLGGLLILLKSFISNISFHFIKPPNETLFLAKAYFNARILAAPAALANFAFLGWIIGMHKAKHAFYSQFILNVTNIVLDLLFVVTLGYGVAGVAYATVIAEYVGVAYGLMIARKYILLYIRNHTKSPLFQLEKMKSLLSVNGNIFIRSLCLQIAFFYFTVKGASLGNTILAVNAVLTNFQLFTAYALDGFANAAEALVGDAVGKKKREAFIEAVKVTTFWAILLSIIFTAGYALFWEHLVSLLTNVTSVRETTRDYIIWAIILPLLSVWSFQLDGIFIGATHTKPMRNSMIVSLILYLILLQVTIPQWHNHGLWLGFSVFMVLRAATLALGWPGLVNRFK